MTSHVHATLLFLMELFIPDYSFHLFLHCLVIPAHILVPELFDIFKAIIYIYIIQIMCVCMCLSSIAGQTAGPIMTKFGTYMRIDLGMVPTKTKWSHVWSGRVGSLGPFFEAGT